MPNTIKVPNPEARQDKSSMPIGDQTVLHVSAQVCRLKQILPFRTMVDSIGKVKIVNSIKGWKQRYRQR